MSTIKEYAQRYNELSEHNAYTQIPIVNEEWEVIKDSVDIDTYLPSENKVSVTVGIKNLKTYKLQNLESINLSETIVHKRGFVINTGASIWAIDFVPKKASLQSPKQYMAIGGYNTTSEHLTIGEKQQCRNAIQIWQFSSDTDQVLPPKLDMCILHDFGLVTDFKWCPFSIYEEGVKLGILVVLFGDGDIRAFVVPHPDSIRDKEALDENQTVYIKAVAPRLFLQLPRIYNLCIAWGGYNKLACGTKLGDIIVWDILDSLLTRKPKVSVNIPNASLLPIRNITWTSLMDSNVLISSDISGNVSAHDLKDPFMACKIFRVRSTFVCISGTGHGSGFIFGDTDGITRKNLTFNSKKSITLTMHNSLVWSLAVSPFHGIVAAAASDGTVMVKPFSSDEYTFNPKHKLNVLEYTLYKLDYDPDEQVFRYVDGLKPKTSLPERLFHNILVDPIVSVHKVVWNNNKLGCGWVASGGEAGLCRLEFTGCD